MHEFYHGQYSIGAGVIQAQSDLAIGVRKRQGSPARGSGSWNFLAWISRRPCTGVGAESEEQVEDETEAERARHHTPYHDGGEPSSYYLKQHGY